MKLLLLLPALLSVGHARSAGDFVPTPHPLNGMYLVSAEGCGDEETPLDPATAPRLSVSLGQIDGAAVFSYGEDAGDDSALWFFEKSPGNGYDSTFLLTDTSFRGSILVTSEDRKISVQSTLDPAGDGRLALHEDMTVLTKNGFSDHAELCRKLARSVP